MFVCPFRATIQKVQRFFDAQTPAAHSSRFVVRIVLKGGCLRNAFGNKRARANRKKRVGRECGRATEKANGRAQIPVEFDRNERRLDERPKEQSAVPFKAAGWPPSTFILLSVSGAAHHDANGVAGTFDDLGACPSLNHSSSLSLDGFVC